MNPTWSTQANQRGQVVLLAALVLVVALVPMVLAYLQLGYDGDVRTSIGNDPGAEGERLLDRAVQDATAGIAQSYDWSERDEAVQTVRDRLDPPLRTLERARLEDGIAYDITYDHDRAKHWTNGNCPGGPDRDFGRCEVIDGVVVQNRAGGTHVLAVAFDLTVTAPDGSVDLTTVVAVRTN